MGGVISVLRIFSKSSQYSFNDEQTHLHLPSLVLPLPICHRRPLPNIVWQSLLQWDMYCHGRNDFTCQCPPEWKGDQCNESAVGRDDPRILLFKALGLQSKSVLKIMKYAA